MALWKALRMQQGDVVGQAALVNQISLSAALDRSAGESPAGDEEVTLFDLARTEYLQYWTETGRRKQVVAEAERAIEKATKRSPVSRGPSARLRPTSRQVWRLEAEARRLVERGAEQRSKLGQYQDRVDALAKLEAGVETIQARFDSAQLAARRPGASRRRARTRFSAVAAARSNQELLDGKVREGGPQVETAQTRAADADQAVIDARAARDTARTHADERQARLSALRDAADLASLLNAVSTSRRPSRRFRLPRRMLRSRSTRRCWHPSGTNIGSWNWLALGSRRRAHSSLWRR